MSDNSTRPRIGERVEIIYGRKKNGRYHQKVKATITGYNGKLYRVKVWANDYDTEHPKNYNRYVEFDRIIQIEYFDMKRAESTMGEYLEGVRAIAECRPSEKVES